MYILVIIESLVGSCKNFSFLQFHQKFDELDKLGFNVKH